jgi:hypothetical protein
VRVTTAHDSGVRVDEGKNSRVVLQKSSSDSFFGSEGVLFLLNLICCISNIFIRGYLFIMLGSE